ncbi:MAG: hypothetical protein U9R39_00310 [Campylobacterota bacterium]|nr:hypothetical protein [Campylobacterota bacterium]
MSTKIENINVVSQLCEVIEESEKMSLEVMDHIDVVLNKLDELQYSKNLINDIDGIKNNLFITLESMQVQDASRQKIERVVNELDPKNGKFASSAKHLAGDDNSDVVDDDELAALIASMGAGN